MILRLPRSESGYTTDWSSGIRILLRQKYSLVRKLRVSNLALFTCLTELILINSLPEDNSMNPA